MLNTNIALLHKQVERCLFLKICVVIIVIIITNIYGSIQSSSLFLCFLLWLLWWVKSFIWQVFERREETGLACDVFVI
jgi:ABC-type transport system involved in Fe-S cluster assembly fused permease/ATPase subunit